MAAQLEAGTGDVRPDGQFAAIPFHQHHQHDRSGSAVVEDLVESGAHGATAVEHVVHQHDMLVLHIKRQLAGRHLGMHADAGEVVPVEGDIQDAEFVRQLQLLVQALGHPDAAGVDADEARLVDATGRQLGLEAGRYRVQQLLDVQRFAHIVCCVNQVSRITRAASLSTSVLL